MAYYLIQVSYTPEALKGLAKKPQNRLEAVRTLVENLGGRLEGAWLAFGDYDVVAIYQLPSNTAAAAASIAVAAGGAVRSCKTTPLMTFEEGLQAMKQAGNSGYKPPK
jgi:uncharacterized protein with GYD domain